MDAARQQDLSRILALRYAGPFESSGAFLVWLKHWEERARRSYYFWCLRGPGKPVVVDAGVGPAAAAERALAGYVSPAEMLSRVEIEARDVGHVILTHLHWDHAGGIHLFPRAAFYAQESEYRFWTQDPLAGRGPFAQLIDPEVLRYLAHLEKKGRLHLVPGDREVLPGIRCLLAPGHSPGLQAVAVETARGTAVLGSDAAHLFRNYSEDWPGAIFTDLASCLRTYDKLRATASSPDLLFPGHDPRMTDDYPEVAEGVTLLV